MSERVERVTQVVDDQPLTAGATREVRQVSSRRVGGGALVARIVWFIAGVLLTLLALRFIFSLLGANQSNGFANFIYDTSYPFVAPFFNLFSYDVNYGVSRVEVFTLVAMLIYALVAFGISRLVTIGSADRDRI